MDDFDNLDDEMYFDIDDYLLHVAPCVGEWIVTDDIVLDVEGYII